MGLKIQKRETERERREEKKYGRNEKGKESS